MTDQGQGVPGERRLRFYEVAIALGALLINVVAVVVAAQATFAARDAAVASRNQVAESREERYAATIANLGVPAATRLAAIRGLEPLAANGSRERSLELLLVLTTYLTERSKEEKVSKALSAPADIQQAVLTLLNIRAASNAGQAEDRIPVLNLRQVELHGVAIPQGADLRKLDLSGADLLNLDLRNADLSGSKLNLANLTGANLRFVRMERTDLLGADLSCSDVSGADLREAVSIRATKLRGIAYDQRTQWPRDYSPDTPSRPSSDIARGACELAGI